LIRTQNLCDGGRQRAQRGFTLIEILAALSIVGVGTIIFMSFFMSSLALAQSNRTLRVAGDLAENQLTAVVNDPGGYAWPEAAALATGALAAVTPVADAGAAHPHPVIPAVLPPDSQSRRREEDFASRFSWEVYARLPRPEATYLEVTVVVRWDDRGREQVLALTSCAPRSVLGRAS